MWRVHHSGRSSAAKRSPSTSSRLGKDSSFSLWPTGRMREGSAIPRRSDSHTTSGCLVLVFGRRSVSSWTGGSSRSSSRVALVGRLDIGSPCRRTYGQLCNPYLASVMGNYRARNGVIATGNCVATKVVTTLVGRSAGLGVRALARPGSAGSERSSRSSSLMKIIIMWIGRLAGRCPSGEEAQGDVTLGTRQSSCKLRSRRGRGLAASRRRWLGMTRWEHGWVRHPAGRSWDAFEVAGTQRNHRAHAAVLVSRGGPPCEW